MHPLNHTEKHWVGQRVRHNKVHGGSGHGVVIAYPALGYKSRKDVVSVKWDSGNYGLNWTDEWLDCE